MVIIEKETIKNIPLLHVVQQENQDGTLPAVFFIHGITSMKERNIQHAYMLAEKGYRVILPDVLYHGERAEKKHIHAYFWKMVLNTIQELEMLKEHFVEAGLVDENRIGVAGTSMGAIITLGAMAKYEWIAVGVSLMGNPAYVEFAKHQLHIMEQNNIMLPLTDEQIAGQLAMLEPYDATLHRGDWKPRPLMFWHGKKDKVVPYQGAYDFYEALKPAYEQHDVPLSFTLDNKAGHAVPNKGVLKTVEWFDKYL
ncbi:MAG: prolyl oligopeptidase family serine peptidase [Bacillus sp. (in: firmicutes)]